MKPILDGRPPAHELSRDAATLRADRIYSRTGLMPGCDARDIAIHLGFSICAKVGATRISRGWLYYDIDLCRRERDGEIFAVVAAHLLALDGLLSATNVEQLTLALNRRVSGMFSRSA